jgi:hypothetical protein
MLGAVPSLTVAGGAGDDTLVLDVSNGLPLGVIPLHFDGGNTGADTVGVIGTSGDDVAVWGAASVALGGASATYAGVENRTFDGGGGADDLTVDAVRVTLANSQRFQNLHLTDGSRASLPQGAPAILIIVGGGALQLDGSAQLDLADNDLVVDYDGDSPLGSSNGSAYTGIAGLVQSGRNGGAWDGGGIVTSAPAAASGLTSLGIAEAGDVLGVPPGNTQVWNGLTVDATCVIVKYTYAGDANLDGFISGDDYSAIDFAFGVAGAADWTNGDFNYDGFVSGDDYSVIDFNLVAQTAPL